MESATKEKQIQRMRRHRRIRATVVGSAARPRLAVFRSNRYVSAQVINDETGTTLVGLSTKDVAQKGTLREKAAILGKMLAESARQKGVGSVVFDRGGYIYTGSIKAFADGAREGGLQF